MKNFLLGIVGAMIAYDLSIHLIYLCKWEQYFIANKINYWPNWTGRGYQIFWSIYWTIPLALLLVYATYSG